LGQWRELREETARDVQLLLATRLFHAHSL
jgi:hypothetical protein